ncbi:MAG TPA: tetratricopeptide repeat protein [Polyangiaceae bacterium]|nr:tetratricopeptide repeat protein [Polyangiaceae bacterium]
MAFCWARDSHALDADDARAEAQQGVTSVRADLARLNTNPSTGAKPQHPPEQLIAAGDLSLRTKDYDQAIDTFSQVVELFRQGKSDRNAHADGLFLLGEAYFESSQLLSARREYSELLDLANQPPYDAYAGRALARLVDVALHTGRIDTLPAIAQQARKISARDATGSFEYALGKLSFAQGDFSEARRVLSALDAQSPYYHQAQYVLGTMLMKQALAESGAGSSAEAQARLVLPGAAQRFEPALAQFRRVTELPADSAVHRQVIDEAWLAIGRLNYETEAYLDAASAYIRIDRSSPVYYEMLFELAWVYVRVGDYQRAERALEILSVAAPDTLDVADSALLRADLMLRSGRFDRALEAYKEVRDRFDPARERVDSFLAATTDPAVYYDRLVEEGMEVSGAKLPDVVLDWVRQEARGERVFAVIEDVTHARDVLRRSRRLASKLNAVLAAPSRARAFPELKATLERTDGLINQLAQVRRSVAAGLDDVDARPFSGELGQVRAERRELMSRLNSAPVTPADFLRREEQGNRSWSRASQALQRVTLEADRLQAVINGLRRVLEEADKHGVTREPASRARFQAEVEANERDLAVYRNRIESYRQDVETGRVQVGFGDRRYAEDERVRRRFSELLDREIALLQQMNVGEDSLGYIRSVTPILADARGLEQTLQEKLAALEANVAAQSEQLQRLVDEESAHIEQYTQKLDALDQHARLLVGEVAMRSFSSVRDHLKGIVLRADVGIVQQAWELREEQQQRLQDLQRQRALEEQNLDDELREVFDDAGEAL